MNPIIRVIIPAFNEEKSIGQVIREIPRDLIKEIILCDNSSTDNTAEVAKKAGATVVHESHKGYGSACLKGLAYVNRLSEKTDIVVFLDGDLSDYPEEMPLLINPIMTFQYDLVIGSRTLGNKEGGSITPQQVFGNWLATRLIKILFGVKFTDLGPFRAIRLDQLNHLNMQDKDYGWTVEMQVKAAKAKLRCIEVPVQYRKRIGISKISGTIKGTILAGYKILLTIVKHL